MKRKLWSGLLTVLLTVTAVLGCLGRPTMAVVPDTKLGDYSEAPYREVVKITRDEDGFAKVEIPEQYIFSPQLLERTITVNGREWTGLVIVSREVDVVSGESNYYLWDAFEQGRWQIRDFLQLLREDRSHITPEENERTFSEFYSGTLTWEIVNRNGRNGDYPNAEAFVSINGRPWQDTEWREPIIEQTRREFDGRSKVISSPLVWELFLNPANNGHAYEAYQATKPPATPPAGQTIVGVNQVRLALGSPEALWYRDGAVEAVTLDVPVEAVNGTTMVPLRGVLDALGAYLTYWEGTVTVVDGAKTVVLHSGSPTALVNARELSLTRPAEIQNGRTLVPLRFVSEALGYKVDWDPDTHQITISK